MNAPAPYQLETVGCPLCGSLRQKRVYERPDYTHGVTNHWFTVVRCTNCGFAFVNPRPTESSIHAWYPDEFYDVNVKPEQLLHEKADVLRGKLKLVGGGPPGRVLDVGCQKGEFLEVMRRRGWDVEGVEFSDRPPNVFGLPMFRGRLEDAPFAPGSFDLITLWAVLEHVHNPIRVLTTVARLLKKSGRALVLVPNFNSIPARLLQHDDVPRHLLMFTTSTLSRAARDAGLVVRGFHFGDDIFSGSTRGVLNYLWKLANGERLRDIVAQNREPGRWNDFACCLNGKQDGSMLKVDRLDIRLTPYLDRLVNALHRGFIMTADLRLARG